MKIHDSRPGLAPGEVSSAASTAMPATESSSVLFHQVAMLLSDPTLKSRLRAGIGSTYSW